MLDHVSGAGTPRDTGDLPRTRPRAKGGRRILAAAAVGGALATLLLDLAVAPTDGVQGPAQRLMYVHVPAAWTGYLAFAAVFACSVAYAARRDLTWDVRAQAAAEVGVGMTALAIGLGSIWGRAVWGVWWTWDARLVTTAILLLIYVGYLGVRSLVPDPHLNARRAAVVGIVAFVNVPVVHFSVLWWRTLHQPPTILGPGGAPPIDPRMLLALLVGTATFLLLGTWVFRRRLDQLRAAGPNAALGGQSARDVPVITVVPRGQR